LHETVGTGIKTSERTIDETPYTLLWIVEKAKFLMGKKSIKTNIQDIDSFICEYQKTKFMIRRKKSII
jgi:hypothetical protein